MVDVEVAQKLLRRVSAALMRYGRPPQPAPRHMSWDEFLRQPTAAERAVAAAQARQRVERRGKADSQDMTFRTQSRRRRRPTQHAPTRPPGSKPRTDSPRAESATMSSSGDLNLARKFDHVAAEQVCEHLDTASTPRHVGGASARCASASPSPLPPEQQAESQPSARDEIAKIRRLLEQLAESQRRIESRLDAIERQERRPPSHREASLVEANAAQESVGGPVAAAVRDVERKYSP